MKLLITGDWHITNKPPKRRTDDYFETMIYKHKFIIKTAQDKCVCAILQPGDFFDSYKASDFLKQYFIKLYKQDNIPLYTIYGQHDLRFHSSNRENTPLAVMNTIKNMKIVGENYYGFQEDHGVKHYIRGASWNEDIPKIDHGFQAESDFNILLTHRMIIKDKKLWEAQEDYTQARSLLKRNKFDVIVSGDNHQSFIQRESNKILFNCGSLMRSTISQKDHKPVIYIYDTHTREYEEIFVPIKPFNEVMDLTKAEEEKERNEELEAFVEGLQEGIVFKGMKFEKNIKEYIDKNTLEEGTIKVINELLGVISDGENNKRVRRARQ